MPFGIVSSTDPRLYRVIGGMELSEIDYCAAFLRDANALGKCVPELRILDSIRVPGLECIRGHRVDPLDQHHHLRIRVRIKVLKQPQEAAWRQTKKKVS